MPEKLSRLQAIDLLRKEYDCQQCSGENYKNNELCWGEILSSTPGKYPVALF
ncbi:hypothetical protein [Bacterioplanoides sp.]|uniref:hypothetical protein n=1 Tax=Bacterioplanoides sp. TaxID=2066072 RepID=UPI003B59B69B